MRSTKYIHSLLVTGLLAMGACSDFGDMNVDPNEPSSAPASTLLTGAQRSISDALGADIPELYVQHLSETQYTESSRYNEERFDFNGWYVTPLANLQDIIRLNTSEATKNDVAAYGSNNNQLAVARILRAYFYQMMTDRWGPLPYSDALKGIDKLTPSYDSQEAIYTDLIKELTEAANQIDGGEPVVGDIIFDGDMNAWKRFANTLRMTVAMRMSDAKPAEAKAAFESAVTAGLITSDVMYYHLSEANNQNPWYERFITRTDYAISEPLVDYMLATGDPRIAAYCEKALATDEYVGMPYGIQGAGDIQNSEVSFITDDIIKTQNAPLAIYTMAQVHFMLAEAKLKGWNIPGTAKEHYEQGVAASLEQWGVEGYDTFIAREDVAWSDANGLSRIAHQKWVALYMQGYEAWAEWRRLDLPVLAPAPDAMNNSGKIPVRHGYPTSENDLNNTNYKAGVALLGGADGLDTKVWWDKK